MEYVRDRLNNGRVEGLNGKIRTITRGAYGFHSSASLISMIFLCCGGIHAYPAHVGPLGTHQNCRRANEFSVSALPLPGPDVGTLPILCLALYASLHFSNVARRLQEAPFRAAIHRYPWMPLLGDWRASWASVVAVLLLAGSGFDSAPTHS